LSGFREEENLTTLGPAFLAAQALAFRDRDDARGAALLRKRHGTV